jgi:hypothetical protein
MNEYDQIEALQTAAYKLLIESVQDGGNPLAIAGVYVATALRVYREILDDAEYDSMVDAISLNRYAQGITPETTDAVVH